MGATEELAEEERPGLLDPREDVRAAYCRKLAQIVLKRAGVTEPPVPVAQIAKNEGLAVIECDLPRDVDAILVPHNHRIEVARGQASVRQRFSIAHELGHHFLRHAHGESPVAEQQANIFAGALLAPSRWLRRDIGVYRTPDALAARYEVSREAIFIALKDGSLLNKLP